MAKKSRMFPFITETWNPIGGRCPHNCIYCWSMGDKGLVKKYNMKKYTGPICLVEKELNRKFNDDDFVFVQDMSDLFANVVPKDFIEYVLYIIRGFPKTKFLLLTKNPSRYAEFEIPENCICGATIESNLYYPQISNAIKQGHRLSWMNWLSTIGKHKIFISIEPILNFDWEFIRKLIPIKPWAIAVGYDNYNNQLPEPKLEKTLKLIEELEKFTIVYRKTLKKAWYE